VQGVATALSTTLLLYAENKVAMQEKLGAAPVVQLDKIVAGVKGVTQIAPAANFMLPIVNQVFQGQKEEAQKQAADMAEALGKVHVPNGVAVVVQINSF
jgi:hypothetical protein